jgi:PAS domain S-box-containing protein
MIKKIFENKKPLILVVDDSAFMRSTFRNFLEEEGYETVEAENGMEAINLFEKVKPDIVLMDYVMPGFSGVTTCAKLKSLHNGKETPVIMVTSLEDENSVNLAFEAGATDYISKPINWAVLRQRLSRLIQARNTEKTLNQSEAFARSIIDHAVEGILTMDMEGIIKYINPAAEQIFDYMSEEVIGKNITMIFPKLSYSDFNFSNSEVKFIHNNKEIIGRRKNNSTLPIEITISKFNVDEKLYFTIIMRDITERKRYEETIKYQAFYDSLTGLPNRILLKDRIATEIANCKQNSKKFAIMFLDLDRFKLINDTLGHDIGDKLLKEVAIRLKDSASENNTIARIGGDEFVILLPGLVNEESVGQIANRIL